MTSGQPETVTVESALVEIDQRVLRLFAMVSEGLGAATAAFLAGDCSAARRLVAADVMVDSLELAIEDLVHNRLMRGPLVAIDVLLPLVAILRIVPELERSEILLNILPSVLHSVWPSNCRPGPVGSFWKWARSESTCGERPPTRTPIVTSEQPSGFGRWTTISMICT
jgi:hypothetical protein